MLHETGCGTLLCVYGVLGNKFSLFHLLEKGLSLQDGGLLSSMEKNIIVSAALLMNKIYQIITLLSN